MELTPQKKLMAIAYRFYQGGMWTPKAGDFYTTTRSDLELYQVVSVENGIVSTRYMDGDDLTQWPEDEFLTVGFGQHRVWVPDFILELNTQ